jgi:xanthine dehydrogenase accessory factor
MLSGARPREAVLARGPKGGTPWFVEPLARPTLPLCIYGAGHVGRALVRVLADLPFTVTWIDTAPARFPESVPDYAKAEVAPDPAVFAANAPTGAFHIVMTYSHPLDLAICCALLHRGDFGFLGLIGSETKRGRFLRRLRDLAIPDAMLGRLTCPIGIRGLAAKEPAMIAVSVAAQLVQKAAEARGSGSGRAAASQESAP